MLPPPPPPHAHNMIRAFCTDKLGGGLAKEGKQIETCVSCHLSHTDDNLNLERKKKLIFTVYSLV